MKDAANLYREQTERGAKVHFHKTRSSVINNGPDSVRSAEQQGEDPSGGKVYIGEEDKKP